MAQNIDPRQLKAFTNAPEQANPGSGHKVLIDVDGSIKNIDWDLLPTVAPDLDKIFAPRRGEFIATAGQTTFGPLPLRVSTVNNVLCFVDGVHTQVASINQDGSDSYAVLDAAPGVGVTVQVWCINPAWTQIFTKNADFTIDDSLYGASINVDNSERDITITLASSSGIESAIGPFARLRVTTAGPFHVKVVPETSGEMRSNPGITGWDVDRDDLYLGYSFDLQDEAQVLIYRWGSTIWSVIGPCRASEDDDSAPDGSGHEIQNNGSAVTQRASLNFVGPNLTATDNEGSGRTDVEFDASALPATVADYRGAGAETLTAAFAAVEGAESLPVDDTVALVRDPVDNTKLARVDVGAVTTGTTRVLTMGDRNVDLAIGGTFPELSHEHVLADITDAGTMAAEDAGDYSLTSAFGVVAFSNNYNDLDNLPDIDNPFLSPIATTDAFLEPVSGNYYLLDPAGGEGIVILNTGFASPGACQLNLVGGAVRIIPGPGATLNNSSRVSDVDTVTDAVFADAIGAAVTITSATADIADYNEGDILVISGAPAAENNGYYLVGATHAIDDLDLTKIANSDGSTPIVNPSNASSAGISINLLDPINLKSLTTIRRPSSGNFEVIGGTDENKSMDTSVLVDVGGIDFGATNGTINKGAVRQAADQSESAGTVTLDHDDGDWFQVTAGGGITIALANLPAGAAGAIMLEAVNFGAHTITWPTDLWPGGSPPTLTSAGTDHIVIAWDAAGNLSFSVRGLDMA